MRYRRYFLPRRVIDILCFLLIAIFLPIIFLFEIFIVLPAFHEPGSIAYTLTFLLATFLIVNIEGNKAACMLVDTSVDYEKLRIPADPNAEGWYYCDRCLMYAPPRAHHCKVCRACILKCDHHCYFTGCCIGHYNHRYFVMFIVYLFIGAIYAFIYNSLYFWVLKASIFRHIMSLYKILCPVLMLVHGSMWNNMFLLFYNLNVVAVVLTLILLIYHGKPIVSGGVSYERRFGYRYRYDSGWRRNLKSIFGHRWHLVWLSPFIQSNLPDDGVNWNAGNRSTNEETPLRIIQLKMKAKGKKKKKPAVREA